ncbi:MAG: cyclic nucleotide-binding domain-containing protein [Kordiimonadaceae bacterium]|jgi:voltage-gated potassium channel|nr:cyclic nucleotide-binding domain-containing protein [Kordiimonadaceae bacterium]MBT6036671.1 cyclic nucleotide-binding domain-containing protein [Kordiimonadaceae bacterium]MBT6329555.1 cyclic nucleotide-binding domain-containing protein [Kordiimonadaceae bacterium]MBT7581717.1 cyclic nucleotide-binding domain-containing protein [Kordiimonadaceae bacterium]
MPTKNISLRRHIFDIIEIGASGHLIGRFFDVFMVILILLNVCAVAIETVDTIGSQFAREFLLFEIFSLSIFIFEYSLRIWTSVEYRPKPEQSGKNTFRARFVFSPLMVIDFIAIAPTILFSFVGFDLRFLRVFRFLRLFKLMRYSPALSSLGSVFYAERRALIATLIIMLGLVLFASTIMYYLERFAQPDAFGSIPNAMWWAFATLTTIGYGDVVPITMWGKIFGAMVMVLGVGVYALPIGIVASGFASEIHRRDFVIRWGLVANVPLFHGLDANLINTIAKRLRSQVAEAGKLIAYEGEDADKLFLIVSGSIRRRNEEGEFHLNKGAFFGAKSLMQRTTFRANYMVTAKAQLLVLDAIDFHHLLDHYPSLKERIEETHTEEDKDDFGQTEVEELE